MPKDKAPNEEIFDAMRKRRNILEDEQMQLHNRIVEINEAIERLDKAWDQLEAPENDPA